MKPSEPIASFTITPCSPSTSQPVRVVDSSSDPLNVGIAWRAWDFGDGGTSVGETPVHRYARPGAYDIGLTLATFDGRVAHRTRRVQVAEP